MFLDVDTPIGNVVSIDCALFDICCSICSGRGMASDGFYIRYVATAYWLVLTGSALCGNCFGIFSGRWTASDGIYIRYIETAYWLILNFSLCVTCDSALSLAGGRHRMESTYGMLRRLLASFE